MVEALEGSLSYDAFHIVGQVVTRAHGTLYLANHSDSISSAVEWFISLQDLPKFDE